MEITLKEVEVTKLNLKEGDKLLFTIKSDNVNAARLRQFSDHMQKEFPNNKVIVMGVSLEEDIRFIVSSKEEPATEQSYCQDCDCGKKP